MALQAGCSEPTPPPSAVDGVLDLRAWSGEAPAVIRLHGAWELAWGRLLSAAELGAGARAEPGVFHDPALEFDVDLGGAAIEGRPREGAATYHLRVLLPTRSAADEAADPWMLAVEGQGRPYHLEVVDADGRPLAPPLRAGRVSPAAALMIKSDRDLATPLLAAGGRPIDLVLQTSYFDDGYRSRGTEVAIGRRTALAGERAGPRQDRLVIIGICLVMGLYHLGLWALRRSERAPLFFALLCLAFAVRQFFRFDLFEDRLPALDDFPLHASLEYASFFVIVPLFVAFLGALFSRDIPRQVTLTLGLVAAASCLGLGLALALSLPIATTILSVNEIAAVLVVLVVAAAMTRVILRRRDPPVTTILAVGIGLLLVCTVNDLLHNRGLIETRPLEHVGMFSFIFAQALVLALVNMRARRTAERLARGLGRFVPREFITLLGKEDITDVELGDAVHREVTVLFCDIRGFTGLSERIEVREIFALLNTIYARLGPLVREHRGFVDKYIGDAIMALFPGDPADAVAAAAAIAEAIADVILPGHLARTESGRAPRLSVGIGVHRGPVMLGTIGERQRMEATVISDAVNVASRLEGLSKRLGAGVLLSDAVFAALGPDARANTRSLGRIRLPGKQQSVGVHELFAADPAPLRAAKEAGQRAFAGALGCFQAGEFGAAEAGFRRLADAAPDRAAEIYAEAAAACLADPPSAWDGALEISRK